MLLNILVELTIEDFVIGSPTSSHYLYLLSGDTHTGASVYTAGKLIIKLYGHATF